MCLFAICGDMTSLVHRVDVQQMAIQVIRLYAAGIVTSLLVALLGQARVYVVLGRSRLLPQWLASVSRKFKTPLHATIFTGITAGMHSEACLESSVVYMLRHAEALRTAQACWLFWSTWSPWRSWCPSAPSLCSFASALAASGAVIMSRAKTLGRHSCGDAQF